MNLATIRPNAIVKSLPERLETHQHPIALDVNVRAPNVHAQFLAGYNALIRAYTEYGPEVLTQSVPSVLNCQFRNGWETAASLTRALANTEKNEDTARAKILEWRAGRDKISLESSAALSSVQPGGADYGRKVLS